MKGITAENTKRTDTMSLTAKILVIDDEDILLKSCERALGPTGHYVITVQNPEEGFDHLENEEFDLVLSDLKMPKLNGIDVLRKIKEDWPGTEVIIMTGHGTVNTAVSAMKLGAYDYIEKPFTPEALNIVVDKAMERKRLYHENALLREEIRSHYIKNIIGKSQAIEKVFKLIASVAPKSSTVLITGESGTGKELVARAIHYNSPRSDTPFIVVDCGTISETLIESELFGHIKGAFTGATETKRGLIAAADGGTLFLDEIGNLPLPLQSKLLRVLQEKEYRPIGEKTSFKVDIRFIAATNRDLKKMTSLGTFREDLYYRINIFPISIPPLRQRKEDIPLLTYHFIKKFSSELIMDIHGIAAEALNTLIQHDWRGNVRELENTIHRAMLLCERGVIQPRDITLFEDVHTESIPGSVEELKQVKKVLRSKSIEHVERSFVLSALERNDWNVSKAAKDVGMQRTNFHALIRKYDILSQNGEDRSTAE
jgi:DNA-binding NtrC family response regulator